MTYKNFLPGEVFTAADANNLMRQGIIVVADQAERDAISATEGMRVYRLDTHGIDEHDGANWSPYDTGWVDVPISDGFAGRPGQPPRVRRMGKGILVKGGFASDGITASSTLITANFPAGFRPIETSPVYLGTSAGDANASGLVTAGGDLQVRTGAVLSSYYLFGSGLAWTLD